MKRCPQCDSLFCNEFACRFSGLTHDQADANEPKPIRVRGILFRDEDDAHDYFEQRVIDETSKP